MPPGGIMTQLIDRGQFDFAAHRQQALVCRIGTGGGRAFAGPSGTTGQRNAG